MVCGKLYSNNAPVRAWSRKCCGKKNRKEVKLCFYTRTLCIYKIYEYVVEMAAIQRLKYSFCLVGYCYKYVSVHWYLRCHVKWGQKSLIFDLLCWQQVATICLWIPRSVHKKVPNLYKRSEENNRLCCSGSCNNSQNNKEVCSYFAVLCFLITGSIYKITYVFLHSTIRWTSPYIVCDTIIILAFTCRRLE